MVPMNSLLEEALEAWRGNRHGLIAEVQNIPSDRFEFRATPEMRSVRELVQHILEVAMMMTGELTRPDTNMQRAPWRKLLGMYAQPAYRARTKPHMGADRETVRVDLVVLDRVRQAAEERVALLADERDGLAVVPRAGREDAEDPAGATARAMCSMAAARAVNQ